MEQDHTTQHIHSGNLGEEKESKRKKMEEIMVPFPPKFDGKKNNLQTGKLNKALV